MVRLFSNRSQMTSKCGKSKKVAHEAKAVEIRMGLQKLCNQWKTVHCSFPMDLRCCLKRYLLTAVVRNDLLRLELMLMWSLYLIPLQIFPKPPREIANSTERTAERLKKKSRQGWKKTPTTVQINFLRRETILTKTRRGSRVVRSAGQT